MKVSVPLYLVIGLCPEMIYYQTLPRKKKKRLKKKALGIFFNTIEEYADKIIKEHENTKPL